MARVRSMLLWAICGTLPVAGCTSARDVRVSGRVAAPSTLEVSRTLVIDVIDVVGEGKEARRTLAERGALEGLGDFETRVMMEGDQLMVRVLDDRDEDGNCSAGEAWAETHAPIEADEATDVSLMLWTRACPAP
jgi:hypothetical protein